MRSIRIITLTIIVITFISSCTNSVQQEEVATPDLETSTEIDSSGRMSLSTKSISIEVSPKEGGRISSLKHGEQELLSLQDVHPINWGSTFWVSPQATWGWPPPVAFDSLPYAATKTEQGKIILQGSIDKQKTGTSITKTISVDHGGQFVEIEYEIKNETDSAISVAPWEITRVPVDGLSFYPAQPGSYTSPFNVIDSNNCVWFDYKSSIIQEGHAKLISSATSGWLAHVNGKYLLVKVFPHEEPYNAAPNEGEIEIYAKPDKIYIELEPQGQLVVLESGKTSSWVVKWYVQKLPENLTVEVGSEKLINYVKSLVQ